jgi:hypothetical protein
MTNPARAQEYTIEAQHLVCPERWCASGAWQVQRAAQLSDVWQLTHATDGGAWTVAAAKPVCPRCGTTLVTTLDLEGGRGGGEFIQPGKLLDWLLTL